MLNDERPIDRIKKLAQWYIDKKALPSMKAFELSCGLSEAYIKNMYETIKGNTGVDSIAKIYKTYKSVSLEWLVLGEGEMLTTSEEEAIANAKEASKGYSALLFMQRMMKKMSKEELKAIIEKL